MKELINVAKSNILYLVLVLLLSFLIRLPYINVPFERDEGEYAYGAQLMRAGGIPYRDMVFHRGPVPFLIYRAAFLFFGERVSSVHLALNLWVTLTVFFIYLLSLRLFGNPGVALFSALCYIFLTFKPIMGMGTAALSEIFMALPIIAGALLLHEGVRARKRNLLFLSGLCMGCAVMIKQTALLELLFFLIAGVAGLWRVKWALPRLCLAALSFVAGCGIVPAAIVSYFALHHALHDFVYYVFTFNKTYMIVLDGPKITYLTRSFMFTFKPMLRSDFIFCLACAYGIWRLFRAKYTQELYFMAGWLACSVAAIFAGNYFSPHYFQQIYPAAAIIAGAGLFAARDAVARLLVRVKVGDKLAGMSAGALILALAVLLPVSIHGETLFAGPEAIAKINYSYQPFVESVKIGKYLAQQSSPGDTIYVFGSEPQIYFYAKRKSSTRFITTYLLWSPSSEALDMQKLALSEVTQGNPRFIVLMDLFSTHMWAEKSEKYLLTGMDKLIKEKYELDSVVSYNNESSYYYWGGQEAYRAVALKQEAGPGRKYIYIMRLKKTA